MHAIRNYTVFLLLTLLLTFASYAADDFLKPDEAFQSKITLSSADMIRAEWEIADEYYMYRHRFKFVSETDDIKLGTPIFPNGKLKTDEFFGEVEIYRDKVVVEVPIISRGSSSTLALKTGFQGCADAGLCYTPQTRRLNLDLASAPPAAPPPHAFETSAAAEESEGLFGGIRSFGQKLGFFQEQKRFLEPDEAFIFSNEVQSPQEIRVRWDIAEGYYLYREKFKFKLVEGDVLLQEAISPPGKMKVDENFGEMEVYFDQADIQLPLVRRSPNATAVVIEAHYQGCASDGFCYPPMVQTVNLNLPQVTTASLSGSAATPPGSAMASPVVSEQDKLANALLTGNIFITLATFFGLGILLAFTPCVLPMAPILSSIIVGEGENVSTKRAFSLSLAYVLAMAATYTIAGVLAGLFGANLQAMLQNPWIISAFSLIFVVLALAMFGAYQLQIPASWQTKLSEMSKKQRGGTLVGAGIMGFLSALIVGPCVAAPLAGALIYIGQTGDGLLGGLALFSLSMGMGLPLLMLGTSAGKILPRVGPWMDTVKAFFGILLLGLAIWMMERIIPANAALFLWGVLFIGIAVFIGAFERIHSDSDYLPRLKKTGGLVLLFYGIILLVGAGSGGRDMFNPLANLALAGNADGTPAATLSPKKVLGFQVVKGEAAFDQAMQAARAQQQTVMVDFYADWCTSCKEMEKNTFTDLALQQRLASVTLIQVDVTDYDDDDQALLERLDVIGPPTFLFYGADGQERPAFRLVGTMGPEQFLQHVNAAFSIETL